SEPTDPVAVARKSLEEAQRLGRDVMIVDTAGRLTIDLALMAEVRSISAAIEPDYTFLVIDAMTGQDAVNTAKAFNDALALLYREDYDAAYSAAEGEYEEEIITYEKRFRRYVQGAGPYDRSAKYLFLKKTSPVSDKDK
ncbi:MAG: hypothetical protein M0033_10020, partial [Nitrospiraceae bacterium]|nr:hypothetical protein [Nitrospiraceae bacterium]